MHGNKGKPTWNKKHFPLFKRDLEILQQYNEGTLQRVIGLRFNLSKTQVHRVIHLTKKRLNSDQAST